MPYKKNIDNYIDTNIHIYKIIATEIHNNPETSNHEFFASKILSDNLAAHGFEIKLDVAGHRTAFDARYKSNKAGPVIVFLAEYDALVGLGHGCGHNLFGSISILSAISLKQIIDKIGGEIRVYGTPGEEGGENGWSKDSFVKQGFFDDVDFALCVHPNADHTPTPETLAVNLIDFEFIGKPSHASAYPDKGLNALDAVIQVFNAVNAWRQQLPKDARVHGIITNGGSAPNIIPDYASARFYLRSASKVKLKKLKDFFINIIKGSALATGTSYKIQESVNSLDDTIVVPLFNDVYLKNLALYIGEFSSPAEKRGLGSTDVGNVSQVVPMIQPFFKISEQPISMHTVDSKNAAISEYGLNSIALGAKVLALTAIELILNHEVAEKIKLQHQEILIRRAKSDD